MIHRGEPNSAAFTPTITHMNTDNELESVGSCTISQVTAIKKERRMKEITKEHEGRQARRAAGACYLI